MSSSIWPDCVSEESSCDRNSQDLGTTPRTTRPYFLRTDLQEGKKYSSRIAAVAVPKSDSRNVSSLPGSHVRNGTAMACPPRTIEACIKCRTEDLPSPKSADMPIAGSLSTRTRVTPCFYKVLAPDGIVLPCLESACRNQFLKCRFSRHEVSILRFVRASTRCLIRWGSRASVTSLECRSSEGVQQAGAFAASSTRTRLVPSLASCLG